MFHLLLSNSSFTKSGIKKKSSFTYLVDVNLKLIREIIYFKKPKTFRKTISYKIGC